MARRHFTFYFQLKKRTKRQSVVMSAVLIDVSCYVHEIPLSLSRIVCGRLDQNGRWRQLAREIGYTNAVIDEIGRSKSPSAKLLSLWSDQNHTVTELFMALYHIREFRSMEKLRDLVDSAHHDLIRSQTTSLSSLKAQVNAAVKSLKHHRKSTSVLKPSHSKPNNSKFVGNPFDTICGIPQISYDQLKDATNGWCNDKILGSGGFGTVYRGKWKCTEVAIKRVNCMGYNENETTKKRLKQIMVEMQFLNEHRHDNILPLYGFSYDPANSSACLVYQMMARGSLENQLRQKKSPLDYKQRLNIAIGTARGLQFLHAYHKRATVHGDIKSANILLDNNMQPKIGDFGLACRTNGHTKSKRLYGTHAYLADDFVSSLVITTKNDVWAFGIILFELATSLPAYDMNRESFRKLSRYMWAARETTQQLHDLVDQHAKMSSRRALPVLMQLIKIGFSCTRPKPNDRPEMSDNLNSLLQMQ